MKKETTTPPTKQSYVEPVGFKGTAGEWGKSGVMNFSDTLVAYINAGEKAVAQLRGCTNGEEKEAEANAKLISKSKEIAKALQDIVEKLDISGNMSVAAKEYYHDVVENAKQVLKEAGLKQD